MERLRIDVTTVLTLFVFAMTLLGNSLPGAAQEEIRYVPQLELTDLRPFKVSFCPDDETLLLVVNDDGRIDLFDTSNPGRPMKITEIANSRDAAFTPKGTPRDKIQIVSGGKDGSLRLWTLDGTPEAVRESLVPREIEHQFLRGVLVTEADDLAFMNVKSDKPVDPAAIIEMLVVCGLLNRNRTNRRLQFAYDPVAEHLAAWRVAQGAAEGVAALKDRILSAPDSAIGRAMAEIKIPVEAA
jgi:WD40 repeat protein